jgi:hypothetical protein
MKNYFKLYSLLALYPNHLLKNPGIFPIYFNFLKLTAFDSRGRQWLQLLNQSSGHHAKWKNTWANR